MVLRRWDPFMELRQMQQNMDRLWQSFLPGATEAQEMEGWAIPLDVVQEGDDIMVHASLPGVRPEDIQVSIEDNVLTIRAQTRMENNRQTANYLMRECRSGSFHRALRLPDTVDIERAQTSYQHGVLTVTFPKVESKRARQLKVQAGAGMVEGQRTGS